MPSAPRNRQTTVLGILLFLSVFGLFLPALRNDFINYDDPQYVTENVHVQGGLTWAGVRWAFDGGHAANWHPLTWLSHMADCSVFGLKPWGHHLTSILLHALNALLLFLLLRRMTGATWRSLFVAALFGLHPLHVESVAWVAERKDVLSTLFYLLTLGAYAAWAGLKSGNWIYYVLALLFLALGLMSKPMLVSVPFVLLLLDYWPLGRFRPSAGSSRRRTLLRLAAEKIPFFAVAAAGGIVTMIVQRQAGAVGDLVEIPFGVRIENALISCCRYLGKTFYPENLSVFYPYPDAWPLAQAFGAAALLLVVTAVAAALRRKYPYVLVGWLWFLVTLGPVIGLVQVGSQSMADRYMYIPSIGVFVLLVWGAHALTERWRGQAAFAGIAAAAVLAACALLTLRQIAQWTDSETLFRHALAVTENNWLADNNLGLSLTYTGRAPEAVTEYEKALQLRPAFIEARGNLANALLESGRTSEAIAQYQETLRMRPSLPETHNNLGNALVKSGDMAGAIAEFEEAIRLNPDYAEAQNNLANLLVLSNDSDRLPEAVLHYRIAVRLKPRSPEIHNDLGCALARLGRTEEAGLEFEEALRLKPDYGEARANLEHLRGQQ